MARTKASKPKVKEEVDPLIEEAVSGSDLLGGHVEIEISNGPSEIIAKINPMKREKTLVGYNPITGEEIYI